jgi:hypothetical protein
VAYAPADNPRIASSVIVEHGEHGSSTAAPIAKELIVAYFHLGEQEAALDGGRTNVRATQPPVDAIRNQETTEKTPQGETEPPADEERMSGD